MNDRFLSFLGICRKAHRLSLGHDACLGSIINGNAKLCILTSDASDRLKKEFIKACGYNGRELKYIETDYTSDDMKKAVGMRAAVLTADDEGFAKKTAELHEEMTGRN
ncbi:MAG: ribosomal L7Ae/L30e/S12e/Gadd45 family protein [Clostridiales bacterium]|nr:ribosomal L7Ae/L30e/S12e/Gadd45 family protein [Clostridiales bacterium]